jgi:hypothetical protein
VDLQERFGAELLNVANVRMRFGNQSSGSDELSIETVCAARGLSQVSAGLAEAFKLIGPEGLGNDFLSGQDMMEVETHRDLGFSLLTKWPQWKEFPTVVYRVWEWYQFWFVIEVEGSVLLGFYSDVTEDSVFLVVEDRHFVARVLLEEPSVYRKLGWSERDAKRYLDLHVPREKPHEIAASSSPDEIRQFARMVQR